MQICSPRYPMTLNYTRVPNISLTWKTHALFKLNPIAILKLKNPKWPFILNNSLMQIATAL